MSDMGVPGDGGDPKRSVEDEAALSARLRALGQKLDKAEAESKRKADIAEPTSGGMQGMGFALKVASEFASGVLVGAGLGWLIDKWLGTSPWGMILLLMLGFVAGVLNVLRAVGKVAQPEERRKPRSGEN
jgi:ATP synthase protein I